MAASASTLPDCLSRLKHAALPLLTLLLAIPAASNAASTSFSDRQVAEIKAADEADQRGLGRVDLLYSDDKFNLYLPQRRSGRQQILIVHDVADDEPLVEAVPHDKTEGRYCYSKKHIQKLIELIFENSNAPRTTTERFEFFHYVRDFHRSENMPGNGKKPLLYGIANVNWKKNGKLHGNPCFVYGMDTHYLTVNDVAVADDASQERQRQYREHMAKRKERAKRQQAEAKEKKRQRLIAAEKARKGTAIPSKTPPSIDNIAEAYINEALAYKFELHGTRTLGVKGTNAGVTIKEITIHQCSPGRTSYHCSYTMTQKIHLDAGSQLFAKTFGIKTPEEIKRDKQDNFVLTASGWRSPSLADELYQNKLKQDQELYEQQQRNWQETQQRWQEEALDLLL
ncbi:MAG: hypothetical protein AB2728_20800 [Candidatus Thiodiazotropha sp.]